MLAEELKPEIDATLRTQPDARHTSIVGSSLGGLTAAYGGIARADVFGLVGALSPSSFWDMQVMLSKLATVPNRTHRAARVYLDSGDINDSMTETATLAQAYRNVGYVDGVTFKYLVQAGATHSETYWAQRLPGALAFLLSP
jgi:predicted alpha/beta superfamily hydrolase